MIEGEGFFSQDSLAWLRDLGNALVRMPEVRRSESVANAKDFFFDPAADLVDIGAFIRAIPREESALRALRERALDDPIYPKYLVAPDGGAVALDLSLYPMTDREWVESGADEAIRRATLASLAPGRSAYFTGRPHIKARAYHQMVWDLLRLIPLAVAVATVVAALLTGSLRAALLPLAACLSAALWTAAAMVWCGIPLNLITLVLPSTLIALGGLYGIHVMGRYDVECVAGGSTREIALRTLRYTTLPVVVAGTTTCVGFGALLLARTPATTELGWFAVFGIVCLTLISLSGVPAALALLPARAVSTSVSGTRYTAPVTSLLAALTGLVTRWPAAVIAVWALLALGAGLQLIRVEVDTDYLSFFLRIRM